MLAVPSKTLSLSALMCYCNKMPEPINSEQEEKSCCSHKGVLIQDQEPPLKVIIAMAYHEIVMAQRQTAYLGSQEVKRKKDPESHGLLQDSLGFPQSSKDLPQGSTKERSHLGTIFRYTGIWETFDIDHSSSALSPSTFSSFLKSSGSVLVHTHHTPLLPTSLGPFPSFALPLKFWLIRTLPFAEKILSLMGKWGGSGFPSCCGLNVECGVVLKVVGLLRGRVSFDSLSWGFTAKHGPTSFLLCF